MRPATGEMVAEVRVGACMGMGIGMAVGGFGIEEEAGDDGSGQGPRTDSERWMIWVKEGWWVS